jgi:DNA-binding NarL/FixJ family response regulator
MSYGPVTARALNAQWTISAYSGIGMVHSCCNLPILMPQVFDKIDMLDDSLAWDFKAYTPDVVTICLGQNDGVQDSSLFCGAYVNFIETLRKDYPKAAIVCLTSPMANDQLSAVLKNYLYGIAGYAHAHGDSNVFTYAFSSSFNNGCGGHPDMAQHQLIAKELTAFLKATMHW